MDAAANAYVVGPLTGNQLLALGPLTNFDPLIRAWSDRNFLQSMRAPRPIAPPTASFKIEDVVGTYRRNPVQNDYHVGTISLKPGSSTVLIWTNQAGVTWNLTPDFSQNVLLKVAQPPVEGQHYLHVA